MLLFFFFFFWHPTKLGCITWQVKNKKKNKKQKMEKKKFDPCWKGILSNRALRNATRKFSCVEEITLYRHFALPPTVLQQERVDQRENRERVWAYGG
jgi:hypothetical protein